MNYTLNDNGFKDQRRIILIKFTFIDFLNSHWHDWRGTGRQEDRMLKPEWWEIFFTNWGIEIDQSLDPITSCQAD